MFDSHFTLRNPIPVPNMKSEEQTDLNYLLRFNKYTGRELRDIKVQREMRIWIHTNLIDLTQIKIKILGQVYCRIDLFKSIKETSFISSLRQGNQHPENCYQKSGDSDTKLYFVRNLFCSESEGRPIPRFPNTTSPEQLEKELLLNTNNFDPKNYVTKIARHFLDLGNSETVASHKKPIPSAVSAVKRTLGENPGVEEK